MRSPLNIVFSWHLVNTKRFMIRFQPVVIIVQLAIVGFHLKTAKWQDKRKQGKWKTHSHLCPTSDKFQVSLHMLSCKKGSAQLQCSSSVFKMHSWASVHSLIHHLFFPKRGMVTGHDYLQLDDRWALSPWERLQCHTNYYQQNFHTYEVRINITRFTQHGLPEYIINGPLDNKCPFTCSTTIDETLITVNHIPLMPLRMNTTVTTTEMYRSQNYPKFQNVYYIKREDSLFWWSRWPQFPTIYILAAVPIFVYFQFHAQCRQKKTSVKNWQKI